MNHLHVFKRFIFILALALGCVFTVSEIAFSQQECGNGVVEDPEECDDGNTDDGDGCSANCIIEPGATCDDSMPSMCGFGCEITVIKQSSPAYNTEFDFLRVTLPLIGSKVFDQFSLADSASPETTFSVPFLSATFLAEYPLPPGWQLDNIDCGPSEIIDTPDFVPGDIPDELDGVDFGNIVLAICILDGEATCTFENSAIEDERCNIDVTEEVVGFFKEVPFPFELTAGDPENPPLDENFDLIRNETMDFPDMPLSSLYTITQNTPEDFNLDDIQCTGDADFDFILGEGEDAGTVQVMCNSPGEVNCTFVNSPIIIRNVPTLSEWGLIATAIVLGMAGIVFYRRRMLRA